MKNEKILYVCKECGATSLRWLGKCPDCGAWNSYEEQISVDKSSGKTAIPESQKQHAQKISEMKLPEFIRSKTGLKELDRVLGGGLVDRSVVLISGEPGIGKSTLLLQICAELGKTHKVLYVSGEESGSQLKLRAERLQINGDGIYLLTETDVDLILEECDKIQPDIIIMDSVQTLQSEHFTSSPGSLTQVREGAAAFISYGKKKGASVFLVGHINKEGGISGPKMLEHMVDAVLYFEGARTNTYRIIRAMKNRYGSTDEIGVFEMRDTGLKEIPNPSEALLAERPKNIGGSCMGCVMQGSRPLISEIQTLVTKTVYPSAKRTCDGFDYNRMSLLIAVLEKRLGLRFYENDVYVNVAGGIHLTEPSADLTLAMALVSGISDRMIDDQVIAFGEIGLAGEVRSVSHADIRVKEAIRLGFTTILLPKKNVNNHMHIPDDIKLIGISHIYEILPFMKETSHKR